MDIGVDDDPPSFGTVLFLIAAPIVAGAGLFVLFETGPIHRLGLYLISAGVLVGLALLLLRRA